MCSVVPATPGQKPFCIEVSTSLFSSTKVQILLRMQELKTLPRTGCKAIGRKFSGFAGSPFLYISDIAARFHGVGKCCEDQHMEIMLDRRVRSIGHFLNMMILMPSRGQGELRDFIERMIFFIIFHFNNIYN